MYLPHYLISLLIIPLSAYNWIAVMAYWLNCHPKFLSKEVRVDSADRALLLELPVVSPNLDCITYLVGFLYNTVMLFYPKYSQKTTHCSPSWASYGYLDSKVYGANMGPSWGPQDPCGPHVGPMNFVTWIVFCEFGISSTLHLQLTCYLQCYIIIEHAVMNPSNCIDL